MTLWLFDQPGHSTPSAPSGAVADRVCADTNGDTPETNGADVDGITILPHYMPRIWNLSA